MGWTESSHISSLRNKIETSHGVVVAEHPLLGMPGFVQDLIAGQTEDEAVEQFEQENRMAERAARLNRDGIVFASWLVVNEGYAETRFEERATYAERMKEFGIPAYDRGGH